MTSSSVMILPILCKFWLEDGVWNGVAEDLPIAVFGESQIDPEMNMKEAINGHIESLMELGELPEVLEKLAQVGPDKKILAKEIVNT